MAKKLQASKPASRRPTATVAPRRPAATLVRPETSSSQTDQHKAERAKPAATSIAVAHGTKRPISAAVGARPLSTRTATKPVPAQSPRPSGNGAAAARQARPQTRIAQQVATRRSHIRAENFGYVIKDLRLIIILAVLMFGALVVLHFVLPQ